MLSANPLSALMARYGRRAGFVLGAFMGAAGAAIFALALVLVLIIVGFIL